MAYGAQPWLRGASQVIDREWEKAEANDIPGLALELLEYEMSASQIAVAQHLLLFSSNAGTPDAIPFGRPTQHRQAVYDAVQSIAYQAFTREIGNNGRRGPGNIIDEYEKSAACISPL